MSVDLFSVLLGGGSPATSGIKTYKNLAQKISRGEATTAAPSLLPAYKAGAWYDTATDSFKANANFDCYVIPATAGDRFIIDGVNAVGITFVKSITPVTADYLHVGTNTNAIVTSYIAGAKAMPADTHALIVNVVHAADVPLVYDCKTAVVAAQFNTVIKQKFNALSDFGNVARNYISYSSLSVGAALTAVEKSTNTLLMLGIYGVNQNAKYRYYMSKAGINPSFKMVAMLDEDFVITRVFAESAFTNALLDIEPAPGEKYIALNGYGGGVNSFGFVGDSYFKIGSAYLDGMHDISLAEMGINLPNLSETKLITYGDSITAQNKWQPLLCAKYGITAENYVNSGIGGSRLTGISSPDAMCNDTRLAELVSNFAADKNIVTILGGANDLFVGTGVAVGDNDDIVNKNKLTVKGALSYVIDYILTANSKAQIIVLGMYSAAWNDGKDNPINGETVTVTYTDYNAAAKAVAEYYHLKFVDLNDCGFNSYNFGSGATYPYSTDYIHPTALGGKRIASAVDAVFGSIFE